MNGRIKVSPSRVIVWWNDSCKQRVEERILSDLLRRPISIIVSLSKTQLFSIHPFKCQLIQWFTLSLLVESLRMELEWFIGILSLFDDQLKWVVFDHLGSFNILIIALLIPLIPWWFHFYGPNEMWNGYVRCFDIVEVKDNLCCRMNATSWKQNGISLHRGCCLLDCDLLRCWINRWIRLWKEMICWFCRLFLLSSDNLSVGEESCESAIPWILDPISFRSILYHLHRLALESRNCNHHHSFPFSSNCNPYSIHCLISINSTHSNSSQWSLFNRITLFRHLFPFYSPCNDPLWWITPHQNQSFNSWAKQSSSTLYSLSLFYPHNQILSTGSRTRDRTLIHHLLSNGKNPYHTQLLLLKQTSPITLNPSTNQIRVKVATLQ